jgi:hypothetical protein
MTTQFDATTQILGPGVIVFDSQTIFVAERITEKLTREVFKVPHSMVGTFGNRLVAQVVDIDFTPVGEIKNAAKFFPYAPSQIGGSILVPNKPVIIWTKSGKKITYAAGFISKLPTLRLGTNKPWLGPMQITCVGSNNVDLVNAAAYNAVTASAFSDTTFDDTLVKTGRYLGTYGSFFSNLGTEEGWEIEQGIEIEKKKVDGFGWVNAVLKGMSAQAKFIPVGMSEADFYLLLQLQGASAILPGEDLSKAAADLVVTSDTAGVTVTVKKAGPMDGSQQYGLTDNRQGQVSLVSRIYWSAGSVQPMVVISI